jgi:hypothetical protein
VEVSVSGAVNGDNILTGRLFNASPPIRVVEIERFRLQRLVRRTGRARRLCGTQLLARQIIIADQLGPRFARLIDMRLKKTCARPT